MKLGDINIGRQLYLGLGLILVFVVGIGLLSWRTSDIQSSNTRILHDHPLEVRSAIGAFTADILAIHRNMEKLPLTGDDRDFATVLDEIGSARSDAFRQMKILHDRYLGPSLDISALEETFADWYALTEENIRLLRAGKITRDVFRVRDAQGPLEERVMPKLRKVDSFARDKAQMAYNEALAQGNALKRNLAIIVVVALLISLIISWILVRGIRTPLYQLAKATEQFREGELNARSSYVSDNEFGKLSREFNALADTIQADLSIKEAASSLAGVMSSGTDARVFFRKMLQGLMERTGSQIGAVYLLNRQKTEFEHFESIGLSDGGRASFSATAREGEFGAALETGIIQRIADIPDDTRFSFVTVSGEFRPREILTIPVLSDHGVAAVVSLASVHAYTDPHLLLLNNIRHMLDARVNSVLAFLRIQELAERLDHQNRELETQKNEVTAQANELTEMNTELEMQKRELGEANRLKGSFLSNMSHELRTPLNSVIALAGVLSRRLAKTVSEEEYGYLDVIQRNGKHLLALINDILDISRIEAGREEISLRQFSIRALVGEFVAMLEPQSREKGVALLNQVGDDLPPVISDPAMCRHILLNLTANAVKFTETGSVKISARQGGDEIHVAVRDTGIGIAADQLPYIFDEFRQVDAGTSRQHPGTGLGLAIARKYATLLHGRITVESTPGKGSTFTFILPLTLSLTDTDMAAAMPIEEYSGLPTARPAAVGGHGQCILVVEDSEPSVIQMTDILTSQGYRVQVSRNGMEALAEIGKSLPDAVILDLMMPEVDGFEVLKAIRGAKESSGLPVLILTAKQVTREELRILKGNNVHQLIQKGDVNRAELLSAVARMVAPPLDETAPSARPAVRKPRAGKPVILVVEDNADNLRTMSALLPDSYTVLEAMDGRTGVEQARRHQPDLILMDIALPVMDGLAALAEIRKDKTLRHIPVVAVTASAMKGDRKRIIASGFDGYISKPVDEKILLKTVHEALNENG